MVMNISIRVSVSKFVIDLTENYVSIRVAPNNSAIVHCATIRSTKLIFLDLEVTHDFVFSVPFSVLAVIVEQDGLLPVIRAQRTQVDAMTKQSVFV